MTDFIERNKRIFEMRRQGYTLKAIGQEIGLKKGRVWQIVKKGDKGRVELINLQALIKEQGGDIRLVKDEYYNTPIESLNLDTASNTIMRRVGMETIGDILDILRFNPDLIPTWRNFGDYRIAELKKKLKEAGFTIPDPESKD